MNETGIETNAHLRQPPHSLEAEQSVLGALLLDPQSDLACGLHAAEFYRHEHREIFAALQSQIAAHRPVDAIGLASVLSDRGELERVGGADYVHALVQCVPSARHIGLHAAIVREKATLRALIAAADDVAACAYSGATASEAADKAATAFAAIQRTQVAKSPRSLAEIAMRRTEHYEALERGDAKPGWPTHIPRLDELLNGGIRPGGLYILAARPGVGKSSLALALAATFAEQALPCLVLSMEMPDEEVADRAVVHAGRVNYASLMSGHLSRDDWGRVAEAAQKLSGLPLFVDDQPALTIGDIKAKARHVRGLKVLVVDYLQLSSGTNNRDNRNTQIEELTRGLKTLAKAEGIAVIALSQLNRSATKRADGRPNLADLRDSGSIEQDADVVMFLWDVRDLGERQIIGMSVDKNRQGPRGRLALDFFGAIQRWGQSTADIDPPQQRGGGFE